MASDNINSGPPRTLPTSTKVKILFGGVFNQSGWMFLAFGMIFFSIFAVDAARELYQFSGELEEVPGKVVSSERTSYSENNRRVYRIHYTFQYGKEYKAFSYTTGRKVSSRANITVTIVKGNPQISRIKGMRYAKFNTFVIFVTIFPLIGLILVIVGFRKGKKYQHLLTNGLITKAKVTSCEATYMRVNKRTVHRYTLSFETDWGSTEKITTKTHMTEKIAEEGNEILYDPFRPSVAAVLKTMPGSIRIENGMIPAQSTLSTLLTIILPTISLGILLFTLS